MRPLYVELILGLILLYHLSRLTGLGRSIPQRGAAGLVIVLTLTLAAIVALDHWR